MYLRLCLKVKYGNNKKFAAVTRITYIYIYFFIGVVYILRNQPRGKRPGFPNDKKCNFNTIAICKTNYRGGGGG